MTFTAGALHVNLRRPAGGTRSPRVMPSLARTAPAAVQIQIHSDYVARRTSEGKSKRETIRCLKHYVAREVYRALMSSKATAHTSGLDLKKSRLGLGWTQVQVAEALGTQPIRVSKIEREARKHFDIRDRYEGLMIDLSKKYGMALDTA